jgi:hypothetical protein
LTTLQCFFRYRRQITDKFALVFWWKILSWKKKKQKICWFITTNWVDNTYSKKISITLQFHQLRLFSRCFSWDYFPDASVDTSILRNLIKYAEHQSRNNFQISMNCLSFITQRQYQTEIHAYLFSIFQGRMTRIE